MDLLLDVRKYYPNIKREDIRVIVLEALSSILPGFTENLAKFAQEKLTQRGIEIKLQTAVTSFDGDEVMIKKLNVDKDAVDESIISSIQSKTVIWTAGVTPVNTIKRSLFKTDKGKIIVDDYLEVMDFPGRT